MEDVLSFNFICFFAISSVVLTYAFHKISPPKTLLNRKLKKPHVGINCIESSETVIGNKQKSSLIHNKDSFT